MMANETDSVVPSHASQLTNSFSISSVESVRRTSSKARLGHEEVREKGCHIQVTNTVALMPLPSSERQTPVDSAATITESRYDVVDWIDELPSPPSSSYNPFADDEQEAILREDPPGSGPSKHVAAAAAKNPTQKKISGSWAYHAPRIAAQNALAKSKSRFSVHKSIRDRTGQKQQKQTARGMRPRIFVNTNFSRRQARPLAGRQAGTARTNGSQGVLVRTEDSSNPEHYTSNAVSLKQDSLNRVAATKEAGGNPEETSVEARPITNTTTLSPYSTTKEHTADRQRVRDGLSPYDRAILIGISMTVAEPSDLRPPINRGNRGNFPEGEGRSDGKLDQNDPLTPTIVITPAKEALISSPSTTFNYSKPRPRVASSVYSRRFSDPFNTSPNPLTTLPALTRSSTARAGPSWRSSEYQPKRDSTPAQFGEDHNPQNYNRHASAYTVFEEDVSSSTSRTASSWEGSPTSAVQWSASMERPRPQSKGWWNYITTPFLTRSNTTASAQWTKNQDHPPLPHLAQAADVPMAQEKRIDSPLGTHLPSASPAFAQRMGHETLWTDFSRWEEDRNAVEASRVKEPPKAGMKSQEAPTGSQGYGLSVPQAPISRPDRSQVVQSSSQEQGFPWAEKSDAQGSQCRRSSIRKIPATSDDSGTPSGYDILSPNDREVPMLLNNTSPLKSRPGGLNSSGLASDSGNSDFRKQHMIRSESNFTEIFGDASPTVHHANIASVVRAGVPVTTAVRTSRDRPAAETTEGLKPQTHMSNPPPYSPPRARLQHERVGQGLPLNSGTNSSQAVHRIQGQPNRFLQGRKSKYLNPRRSPHRPNVLPVTLRDLNGPTEPMRSIEAKRQRGEKEDAIARKVGSMWRGRACFGRNGCFGKGGVEARKRRRWCAGLITGLIVLVILILALALTLPRKRKQVEPEPSRWANITGWPPIPTGVSTIVQPDLVQANMGCVFPSTMWSCTLPKEVQKSNIASDPDQPNFRFEIRYLSNLTSPTSTPKTPQGDTAPFTFPEAPSLEDQRFMGNTTDNVVSALKEGEESPFSITFLPDPTTVSSKQSTELTESGHRKRDSIPFPDIASTIPQPEVNEDGTAKPANLLPVSLSQTLRLYDRELESEHYGFYSYFDRSIFLKSTSLLNQSDIDRGPVPDDLNGGSTEGEARARCTWAQTRFLVQIWTKKNEQTLLRNSSSTTAAPAAEDDSVRPGSFPYPVTITTDRHGGDITKKMIYCYGLDARTRIIKEQAKVQVENRGFGGKLVGGGQGPLGKDRVTLAQGGMGGIDGGTGGCACRWKNFIDENI